MFYRARKLLAWTYAIARSRMIDRWQRTGNRGLDLPIEDFEHALLAEETEAGDPSRDIARLLSDLPSKQRTAIELVKLKELSIAEASAQTGWSASDVKISIHRGLKTLMRLVGKPATRDLS